MMAEEAPCVAVVLVLHQYAHSPARWAIASVRAGGHILFPDHGQEERTGTVHDCYVRESPITVVAAEGFNDHQEERVALDSAHGVVRDPCWCRLPDP